VIDDSPNDITDTHKMTGFGYQKADRLLKQPEFRRVYRSGYRVANGCFTIQYRIQPGANHATAPRLGITVNRRVGNAVVRNRIKRVVREFFRCHRALLPVAIELNVIARKGVAKQPHRLLNASLETLFKKITVRENHQSTD
jgi:ribonuclease P protein component